MSVARSWGRWSFHSHQHRWSHCWSTVASSRLLNKTQNFHWKIQWKALKVMNAPEHLFSEKRLSKLGLEKTSSGVVLNNIWQCWKMKLGCLWWCLVTGPEAIGTNWNRGDSRWASGSSYSLWRELSTDTGCPGGCGVSLLRDLQKTPGHELDQPVQFYWADRLDKVSFRGLFQPPPFFDIRVSYVFQTYVGRYLPHFLNLLKSKLWNC